MVNFSKVKEKDILSETTYYQVDKVMNEGIEATTSTGQPIHIGSKIVEDNLTSASYYTNEVKVSQTELATLLSNTQSKVFEVSFQKQPDSKKISETVTSLNGGRFPSNSELKSKIDTVYRGEERVLRGYLLSVESLMGRAKVVDLEVKFESKSDSGIRLVDLRHINYLIFDGVKYSLKK